MGFELAAISVAILAVGAIDVATGPQLALSAFYLLPVSLAACSGRRGVAVWSCGFAAATWFLADTMAGARYSSPLIGPWNALTRLLVFAVVAALLQSLRAAVANAEALSKTDSLTGVANPRHFAERSEHELQRARRNGLPLAIVYIDLDNFKSVNDSAGHLAGDELLRQVGETLTAGLRSTDLVGRMGGDEFAVLLPETGSEEASRVAAKLQAALRPIFNSYPVGVGASLGVASFGRAPASFDDLVAAADRLMYEAKASGKGSVRALAR